LESNFFPASFSNVISQEQAMKNVYI